MFTQKRRLTQKRVFTQESTTYSEVRLYSEDVAFVCHRKYQPRDDHAEPISSIKITLNLPRKHHQRDTGVSYCTTKSGAQKPLPY